MFIKPTIYSFNIFCAPFIYIIATYTSVYIILYLKENIVYIKDLDLKELLFSYDVRIYITH